MSKKMISTTPGPDKVGKPLAEFDAARGHVAAIREAGRRASHESLLLGVELNRLKLALGVKRGGDRANPQSAGLLPWEKLIEQQTNLSADTCQRCMQLASAAKKHIPILTAGDVLEQPFSELPAARQAQITKALLTAADGRSMTQLMLAFGAWKQKKTNNPPTATTASAAKRTANKHDQTLQLGLLIELSEEHLRMVQDITLAGAYKAMETGRLAHFENTASELVAALSAELTGRRKGGPRA